MTEAEWLAATEPTPMLEFLWRDASKRKQRLLVSGYCRLVWDLLSVRGRAPVEVAERFVDGHATAHELEEARWSADSNSVYEDGLHQQAELERHLPRSREDDELYLREIVYHRDRLHAAMLAHASTFSDDWLERPGFHGDRTWKHPASLVRCILGNPFHPVPVAASWLTSTVLALAEGIYADRAFDRMPILADALQDAGFDNADILSHCRSEGPHARGCWVVDLILGKE